MKEELLVIKEAQFEVSAARLWDTLTNADITPKYMFGCSLKSEWKTGSSITWEIAGKVQVKGTILGIDQGKWVKFTVFDPNMGIPDVPSNYLSVTYELSEDSGITTLKITQGDFAKVDDSEKRYQDTLGGWDYALKSLSDVLKA